MKKKKVNVLVTEGVLRSYLEELVRKREETGKAQAVRFMFDIPPEAETADDITTSHVILQMEPKALRSLMKSLEK